MTPKARKQAAQKILDKPHSYMVCECCGSIVTRKVAVCPNCNGYRFDESPETVTEQANLLSKREPMSIEAGDYE